MATKLRKPMGSYESPAVHKLGATEEQILKALELVAEGWPFKAACKKLKLSYVAARDQVVRSPELRAADTQARQIYMREKVRDMERIALKTPDVQRARLLCDNIKWEASRVLRNEFGDHVTVSGDKENPLMVELLAKSSELVARIRGTTIEGEATEIKE